MHSTSKKIGRTLLKIFSILFILMMCLQWMGAPIDTYAQGSAQLILDINIVDPTSGPLETGQIVEYVIDFSCASTTTQCGSLDIDFILDTELELIDVYDPPGYVGSFSGTAPNITVNIVNNPVSNPVFDDGEAGQVTVRTRVGQNIVDGVIETIISGTINPGGVPVTVTSSTPDVSISPPSGGWGVTKSAVAPAGGLGPVEDGQATYNIAVCPTSSLGVAQLTELVFNDRFPIGATVQSSSTAHVIEDQLPPAIVSPPTPAGDGVDDTIVWTVDLSPLHTVDDGCVNVTYTLAYPSSAFNTGDSIANAVFVSGTTDPNSDPFPDDGDCPTCVGRDNLSGTIENPSVTAAGNKTGPGTTIVSPGVSNGTSTFSIGWDLSEANVSTANLAITDTFPVASSDSYPITEITEITTATWTGLYSAVLEFQTVGSGTTWIPLDTVDGTPAPTYTEANSSLPDLSSIPNDLITNLRYRFTTDVPPGFSTSNSAVVRFFVRDGMTAADYSQVSPSLPYQDYLNCINFTGTYLDENSPPPQSIPASQDCANLRISEDTTTGITNIQTSKSRNKSALFPLEDIQFTLTLQLTQEASGDLLNPAIQDILPFGMQIISWDEVEFINTGAGEDVLPYLRVDSVNVSGEIRQRLLFYWDDSLTGADGATLGTPALQSYSCTPASGSTTDCPVISNPVFPTYIYTPIADPTPPTAPPPDNELRMEPPDTGVKTINIRFTAQPRLDALAGDDSGNLIPLTNTTNVVTDSAIVSCQTGTQSIEGGGVDVDIDDDGIPDEVACVTSTSFQIREASQMASQKWIRDLSFSPTLPFVNSQNLDDPSPACPRLTYNPASASGDVDYTRYPCIAQGAAGGAFEYLLKAQNTGIVDTENYILYDVLPHIGDTGVSEALVAESRLTEFQVYMTGPVVAQEVPSSSFTYIVQYNTEPNYNSCRPEMSSDSTEAPANHWQPGCDNTWVDAATIGANWDTVTSFRIVQTSGVIPTGDELIFTVPLQIDGTLGAAETGEIAWNTFAQRFNNEASGRRLLTAEPRKVGIIIEEVHSVGNRVWFDDGTGGGIPANGVIDGSEVGVNDVTVELYWNNGASYVLYATDVTRQNSDTGDDGYYFFGGLPSGQYFVRIVASEFNSGGDLSGYISSTGNQNANANNNIDSRDTGIDQSSNANYLSFGVRSNNFTLTRDSEATGETDLNDDNAGTDGNPPSNEGPLGRGEFFEEDQDSDLTVDFGFFIPMSIGNQVWLDSNNNALIDPIEDGINGVLVELFRGTTVSGTPYRTTTTSSGGVNGEGYYLFDGIPDGDYIIRLAPSNFQTFGVLVSAANEPYSSSESGAVLESTYLLDNQTDNNDNGIDENFPQTNGIVSNIITLSYNTEPIAEDDPADLNPAVGEGRFGELDNNAEMTIDFGVYSPIMSIGNRVFKDYDNNRILDGADVGVDGVVVNLFFDTDQNGIPDSGINNPYATTTTANGGYYLFDGLNTGYYLVQIDEVNFRTTGNGTLRDYYSSQDKASPTDTAGVLPTDNENDSIEDGIDNPFNPAQNPDPQAEGVFSPTIQLEPSNEPATETDLGPEGNGEPNIQASNSDLTIDFGFYQPMSLGNHVWFDTNNDGLFNGAEAGIAGVQVELYLETDGTPSALNTATDTLVPVFDGTNYVNFDTTDANGFYLFDNLAPGQYWVHIPATDFGSGNVLFNHFSTQPNNEANPAIAPAPDMDGNDNGTPDDVAATTLGVTSELETLGIIDPVNGSGLYIPNNVEPVSEINKSNNPPAPSNTYDGPVSIGRYGELDNNSDITIDFGFILADDASMSIGNRVWFDTNRNGLIDNAGDDNPLAPGNPGIDNVDVLLYRSDVSGNPIGGPIARDITDNGGYYLFDVLDTDAATALDDGDGLGGPVTPGNYVVVIPSSNFVAAGPLETYASTDTGINNDGTLPPSTGVENGYAAINDDNNDNGSQNATYGVISNLITLTLLNERIDEVDKEIGVEDGTDASSNDIALNNSDLTIDFGFYLPMSLGNFVWVDLNNNGVYDSPTEYPVPDGVLLELYESDGTTPIPNPAFPTLTYQTTTNNGFYLFDELPPGDYVVRLIDLNFLPTGLLEGYLGSDNGSTYEDDTDTDQNDNGRDIATPATSDGIPSGVITLAYNTEPLSEATSGNPADGPDGRGNNGELDANSNLTVDFGVYPTTYFSIGNRVWIDDGAGTNEGNGIHDNDELGIANVIMDLFRDENDGAGGPPDGIPDSTTPIATTSTDVDGYYLFDSLASGNYIVSVAPANFQSGGVLRGYSATSRTDIAESPTDHRSDHRNISADINYGFYSATYTLGPGAVEPTGETDPTPAGTAQDPGTDPFGTPIPDAQSNLTVDFGFIPTLSLGNLVWFDIDNDGLYDGGSELGIAGVTVELYLDDGNGTFEGTEPLVNTDVTDGNGYYLFNDLQPGDYFLHIPNNPNWNNGAGPTPLANFMSSGPDAPVPDRRDNNDNGIGTGDTNPVAGITSQVLTLAFDSAPTGESTLSNNPADGPEFRGTSNPTDNNSDLTWDFGFYQTEVMSIGNIVWIDDGNTTGTANDGIRNGDELGVDRVTVELYADSDGDGNPDTTTPLETTTTASGGYYLFDGLPPGQYIVVIAEDNFSAGVLYGYLSTQDGTPDNDDQDNGDDNPTPWSGGVKSDTIVLAVGTEPSPTNPPDDDEAVTGTGANGETDDNSNLTVDFGFIAAYDWGDAPDSYGTDNDVSTTTIPIGDSDQVGPSHRIIADLYLGAFVDDETNGVPVPDGTSNNTNDTDGDGADGGFDEDGMTAPIFVAGTTETVDITVFNNTGTDANLIAWFDWNGNGVFDASEGYLANVPDGTDGIIQIDVSVPVTAEDLTGGDTYARLRLTTESITTSEPTGIKNDGEVEDYYITIRDVNLLINKTDGLNSIMAGADNTYIITIENSGAERTGVRFYDELPLATSTDANGYDPETIEWTCAAVNGASCIANAVAGTGSSGGPYPASATSVIIDELIDLPRNGRVIYTINARVNEDAGQIPLGNTTPIRNVAQLPNETPPLEDEDLTSVIFDPPYGIKVGTYQGYNIIRWTMAWFNPGATQTNVTINDVLPTNQQFPSTSAGINLQCSGSIGTCSIVGDDRVVWTGTMLSSTPANDANAVLIEFNTLVAGDGTYNNTAVLSYVGAQISASGSVVVDISSLPETGFAPNVITDLSNKKPVLYTETGELMVEIPSLGINVPIVGVPLVEGLWDVSWLGNQAGWLEGSAFPSWSGNSIITGHVYGANGLPGPFIDVHDMKYGDTVVIHVDGQMYTYEVQTNTVVEPDDLSIFDHEQLDWLTLVTCKEYDELTNTYGKRVVVRAVLVDVTR